jgi:hypothetical protein
MVPRTKRNESGGSGREFILILDKQSIQFRGELLSQLSDRLSLSVSFRPFCCSELEWKDPPTHVHPSQSCRFCEEMKTAAAWNGRGYSAWIWSNPKWIGHFNKPKMSN